MRTRKQKLYGELKNTPGDISLVSCSVSSGLNREETLSDQNKVLTYNNSEENQRLPVSEPKAKTLVYVLNEDGNPLMPCKPAKARHLLKEHKAKVVSCKPFTIQLLWNCERNLQPITLGIDAGYLYIGFSALTEKQELVSGEIKLRNDVSKKLLEKSMYRRNRRNRKTWYREPRFDNRVSTKKEGWLAPSIKHKLDSHVRLIEKIKSLLPVSNIVVEIAFFDIQKMQNPEISGIEYQQGELQGYEIREYLLEKWNRECAYCGKKNIPLEIEHIIPKSRGGTKRVSNLTIACHRCNQEKGNKTAEEFGYPEIQKKANQSLKSAIFMNIVRKKLVDILKCSYTYGYITKHNRIKLGIEKSHANDAFVIANGSNQIRTNQFSIVQIRRNNRCLQLNRKGFKPSIKKQKYSLSPNDFVRYNEQILRVKGVHCLGKRIVLENKKSVNITKVKLYQYKGAWQFSHILKNVVSLPLSLS